MTEILYKKHEIMLSLMCYYMLYSRVHCECIFHLNTKFPDFHPVRKASFYDIL